MRVLAHRTNNSVLAFRESKNFWLLYGDWERPDKKFTKKLNISLDNSDFYNSFYLLKIKAQILH